MVVLSLVLFLALPLSMLIYIDTAKMHAEVRYEIRQLNKLRREVSEAKKQAEKPPEE